MTEAQIFTILICTIVIGVIVYLIGFICWWNRMEKKKDEIIMRISDNNHKILEKLLEK